MDNLKVNITDIHFRLEEPEKLFSGGILLKQFKLLTTD